MELEKTKKITMFLTSKKPRHIRKTYKTQMGKQLKIIQNCKICEKNTSFKGY